MSAPLQPGDMFHYIGMNRVCEEDYVILVEEYKDFDEYYWNMFEIVTGMMVCESRETLLNEETYRKLA